MIPPATAAEAKNMARNKSPLPKKTVAKKRSSSSPSRSRKTPMNHKNAMPAKGTKFSATATVPELVFSQAPVSNGSARTESRKRKRLVIRRAENRMPAMAAARGVFNRVRMERVSFLLIDCSEVFYPLRLAIPSTAGKRLDRLFRRFKNQIDISCPFPAPGTKVNTCDYRRPFSQLFSGLLVRVSCLLTLETHGPSIAKR